MPCTRPLFFDLETVPDERRLATFNLPAVPSPPPLCVFENMPSPESVAAGGVESIKNLLAPVNGLPPSAWLDALASIERSGKNRKGVHDAIDAARGGPQAAAAAIDERRKLLSTTPEFCRIAALGFAEGDDEPKSGVAVDPDGEVDLLDKFWSLAAAASGPLIGFNILWFDLPVIFVRSAILGVQPSRQFDMRPWGKDIIDVYAGRFGSRGNAGKDTGRPGKLKELAPLMGIDVPAEGVDGSQVEELLRTDPGRLGEYVRSDVKITREYYRKLRGFFWN